MQFSADRTSGNPTIPAASFSLGRSSPPGRKLKQMNRLRQSLSERKCQASLKDDGSPSSKMEIDDVTLIRPVSEFRGMKQFSPSIKQLRALEICREDRPSEEFLLNHFGSAFQRAKDDIRDGKKRFMDVVKQQVVHLKANDSMFKNMTEGQVATTFATAPTIECAKLMMFSMLMIPTCKGVRPGGRDDWQMNLEEMGVKASCEFDDFDEAFDCPIELLRVALPSGQRSLWGSLMERNKPHPPTSSDQGQDSLTTTLAAFLVDQESTLGAIDTAERKDLAEAFVHEYYSNGLRMNADWLLKNHWHMIESKMESFKASLNCKASASAEVTKYERIIKCIKAQCAKQEACRPSKQESTSFHREDRPSKDFLDNHFGSDSKRLQNHMLDEKKRLMDVVTQQVRHLHFNKFKNMTEGQVATTFATAPTIECAMLMMVCMLLSPFCKTVSPAGRDAWKMNFEKMGVKASCQFGDFDEAFDCPIELCRVGQRSLWGSLMERNKPHPPTSSDQGQDSLTTTLAAFLVDQESTLGAIDTAERKDLAEAFVHEYYSNGLRMNADWLLKNHWHMIESKMESFKASLNCKASASAEVTKYERIIKCIKAQCAKQEACRPSKQESTSFENLARQTIANERARDEKAYELQKQRLANDQADKIRKDEAEKRREEANIEMMKRRDEAEKRREEANIEMMKRRDEANKDTMKLFADTILTLSGQKRPREEAAMIHASTTAHQIPFTPAPSAAALSASQIHTPSAGTVTTASATSAPLTTSPTRKRIRNL